MKVFSWGDGRLERGEIRLSMAEPVGPMAGGGHPKASEQTSATATAMSKSLHAGAVDPAELRAERPTRNLPTRED